MNYLNLYHKHLEKLEKLKEKIYEHESVLSSIAERAEIDIRIDLSNKYKNANFRVRGELYKYHSCRVSKHYHGKAFDIEFRLELINPTTKSQKYYIKKGVFDFHTNHKIKPYQRLRYEVSYVQALEKTYSFDFTNL